MSEQKDFPPFLPDELILSAEDRILIHKYIDEKSGAKIKNEMLVAQTMEFVEEIFSNKKLQNIGKAKKDLVMRIINSVQAGRPSDNVELSDMLVMTVDQIGNIIEFIIDLEREGISINKKKVGDTITGTSNCCSSWWWFCRRESNNKITRSATLRPSSEDPAKK